MIRPTLTADKTKVEPFDWQIEDNRTVPFASAGVKEETNDDENLFNRSHKNDVLNEVRLLSFSAITKNRRKCNMLAVVAGLVC